MDMIMVMVTVVMVMFVVVLAMVVIVMVVMVGGWAYVSFDGTCCGKVLAGHEGRQAPSWRTRGAGQAVQAKGEGGKEEDEEGTAGKLDVF